MELSGIRLSPDAIAEFSENPQAFHLVYPDIEKLIAKVKFMQIVEFFEAKALSIDARNRKPQER